MIEIKNLTKIYKLNKKQMKESKTKSSRKVAVDDVSLRAKKGEIYGLLGPNGAGKTTTLRCIATILKPTKGEIYVSGHEVQEEPEEVAKRLDFLQVISSSIRSSQQIICLTFSEDFTMFRRKT